MNHLVFLTPNTQEPFTTSDVIADDKKLIEIYIKVVRELEVKYGVM